MSLYTQLQIGQQAKNTYKMVAETRNPPCWRCGKSGHTADKCFFRSKQCRKCSETGHIAKCVTSRLVASHKQKLLGGDPHKTRLNYVEQE